MRKTEKLEMVEWTGVLLRWMTLVGLSVALLLVQNNSPLVAGVLLAGATWNLGLTLLAFLRPSAGIHPWLIVGIDLFLANLFTLVSSTLRSGLNWTGLLPVFSAALALETRGLLIVILISVLSLGIQTIFQLPLMFAMLSISISGLLYLGVGSAVSLFVERMTRKLSQAHQRKGESDHESKGNEADRLKAIYKMTSTLSATLNYQQVLDAALDLSAEALATVENSEELPVSAVYLFTELEGQGTRLAVGSARRFTPADLRLSLSGTEGLIGRVIDSGQTELEKNISGDIELSQITAFRNCNSICCVPLRSSFDTYGVLLFGHRNESFFTQERREILEIIANQAVIAIQNASLYHDLETEKERILEVQEEARRKLARELHDGPTQSVAALAMRVNFARRLMEKDPQAAGEELKKIEELARKITQEIRHMLFTLRPLVLESQGLKAALETMAVKTRETYNQEVILSIDPKVIDRIDPTRQSAIFYIAEEAISNARKHASANHIWVRIRDQRGDFALLEVEDDGVGFDPQAINRKDGDKKYLGMVNMRERAELVRGELRVKSSPGKGTVVQALIPLTQEAIQRSTYRN